ncbi:hypothetical protein GEMRC1_014048 [Eukaryota sp. GEM-RC1]
MNLRRLADSCPSRFVAFAHFLCCSLASQIREGMIDSVRLNSFLSVAEIEIRFTEIRELIDSRIIYISTPGIIFARILNPALRSKNLAFLTNPVLYKPFVDFLKENFSA